MAWDGLEYYASGNPRWETYTCPYCARDVTGAVVASYAAPGPGPWCLWLRCPRCGKGAVLEEGILHPSAPFGPDIEGLPVQVAEAYDEARNCIGAGAYTAAELICRKILMYVAVDKGADAGKPFTTYLDHLEKAGYLAPAMKGWVDLTRQHGNLATHELDWTRASVDSASVRAKRGGPRGRKSRRSRQARVQAPPRLRRAGIAPCRGGHRRQRPRCDHAAGDGRRHPANPHAVGAAAHPARGGPRGQGL
jgi:hypothetical protein